MNLQPCTACHRHVKSGSARCPFCGGELSSGPVARLATSRTAPLSRVALILAGATTAAACSSPSVSSFYGSAVGLDAGTDAHEAHGDAGAADAGHSEE